MPPFAPSPGSKPCLLSPCHSSRGSQWDPMVWVCVASTRAVRHSHSQRAEESASPPGAHGAASHAGLQAEPRKGGRGCQGQRTGSESACSPDFLLKATSQWGKRLSELPHEAHASGHQAHSGHSQLSPFSRGAVCTERQSSRPLNSVGEPGQCSASRVTAARV